MKTSSLFPLLTLTIILLAGYVLPSYSQESEKLYQKGLVKEEGEGSLTEAIEIYYQVFEDASAERSLRANALLHVGLCYEKLGQEKAKKTYEKLIAEFTDQEETVAIGKRKLAIINAERISATPHGLVVKEIWSQAEDSYGVSPNGRYFNYINWKNGNLAIKDIETGKIWEITKNGTWENPEQFPDNSVWSPDGKKIAYMWIIGEGKDQTYELRIVNLDGTGDRFLRRDNRMVMTWPVAWSPDGKYILAEQSVPDNTRPRNHFDQIVLVYVNDGSIRLVKSLGDLNHYGKMCMSPDGRYIAYSAEQEKGSEHHDIFIVAVDGSYDERIVADRFDDIKPIWAPDGKGICFISNRMGTNDLWSLHLKDGIPTGKPEIVKSDMGERFSFLGITDDQSLYFETWNARSDLYLAELNFASGQIISKPERISKPGRTRNLIPIWSPDGRYVAYQARPTREYNLGRRYIFIIHDTKTGQDRRVFTELYTVHQRRPAWSNDGKNLLVQGRTKDHMQGFYLVDVESGKETPVMVRKQEPGIFEDTGLFPSFTMDGNGIYFVGADKKTIIKRNNNTKQETTLYSGKDEISQFRVSPDESQIAFAYMFENRSALFSMPTSGGGDH